MVYYGALFISLCLVSGGPGWRAWKVVGPSVNGNEGYEMLWHTISSEYFVFRHTLVKQSDWREKYHDRIEVDWPVSRVDALPRRDRSRGIAWSDHDQVA